jgi:hypothetical protein
VCSGVLFFNEPALAQLSITSSDAVLINANENPLGPVWKLAKPPIA